MQGLHEVAVRVFAGTESLPGAGGPLPKWFTPTPDKFVLVVDKRLRNLIWTSSEGYLSALTTWQLAPPEEVIQEAGGGRNGRRERERESLNKEKVTHLLTTKTWKSHTFPFTTFCSLEVSP